MVQFHAQFARCIILLWLGSNLIDGSIKILKFNEEWESSEGNKLVLKYEDDSIHKAWNNFTDYTQLYDEYFLHLRPYSISYPWKDLATRAKNVHFVCSYVVIESLVCVQ